MSWGSKLSPKLRKALFKPAGEEVVRGLVEIVPGTDEDALTTTLRSLGATIQMHSREAHTLTIEIPANRLASLDQVHGILYVEADERYRP